MQDGGGPGITTRAAESGWIRVKWDAGRENRYRIGANGRYDLVVASSGESPRASSSSSSVADSEPQVLRSPRIGVRVSRGPDWSWDDQDGGGFGTTTQGAEHAEGWVSVEWDAGGRNNYRVGADGEYDLVIVDDSEAVSPRILVSHGPPMFGDIGIYLCVVLCWVH